MEELDSWRLACILLEVYGFAAIDHAAERLRELSAKGDSAGFATWSRVLALLNQMQPSGPPPRKAPN
ncbi:MAG TPA: hypothetical protein VG848_14325 [Acetobacteraceae bacterium]|jgi:hypothetical protein|nr:hypothetical protein [Acetobacteraceae bacterium]